MGDASLEQLLLGDLQVTGVYDLAADLGIVQHGQLQEGGAGGWAVAASFSPLPLPHTGLPPSSLMLPQPPQPSVAVDLKPEVHPPVQYRMEPSDLDAADCAVADCLQAAEEAAATLRLAGLQLDRLGSQEAASPAVNGAAGRGGEAAGSPGSPSKEAAEALDQLFADKGGSRPNSGDPAGAAAAAAASKRKRGGGSRRGGSVGAGAGAETLSRPAAAADDSTAAGSAAGGGGGAAAARQGPGKGLRHFSLKVCEKVESKGDTTYEEVANELIADLAAEVAAGLVEQLHDEKNIRRRVYDALNVLEAIGMISKEKKAIQWKGWPLGLGDQGSEDRLHLEKAKAVERVEEKRQALEDSVHKAYCLANLVLRNHEAPVPLLVEMKEAGMSTPNPLTLPFMLVQADQDAEVEVQISEDNLSAHIDFQHWPFLLYDDDHVMRMLNLHLPEPQLYEGLVGSREQQLQQQELQQVQAQCQQQQQQQQQQGHLRQGVDGQEERHREHQQQQVAHNHNHHQRQQPIQQDGAERQNHDCMQQAGAAPSLPPPPVLQVQQQAQLAGHLQVDGLEQYNHVLAAPGGGAVVAGLPAVPRLAPGNAASRLPTPALQLSPDIGSPGALGNGVSAMDLGSPLATQQRAAAAARKGSSLRQQQQPQLQQPHHGQHPSQHLQHSDQYQQQYQQHYQQYSQPILRPPHASAAAGTAAGTVAPSVVKAEPLGNDSSAALADLAAAGAVQGAVPGAVPRADGTAGGWPYWAAGAADSDFLLQGGEPLEQHPGVRLSVPQLRPAAPDTLHLLQNHHLQHPLHLQQYWPYHQQQQQQQAAYIAPQLRPARRAS